MHKKMPFASTAVALMLSGLVTAVPVHAQGCATLSACQDEANRSKILPSGNDGRLEKHGQPIPLSIGDSLTSSGNMTVLVSVPLTSEHEQHLWTLYDSNNHSFLSLTIRGNKLVVGRINQFRVGEVRPFYSFDLWEPTINRLTAVPVVVAARFSPDGKFRIDTFSLIHKSNSPVGNKSPYVDWEQGKQEVGMPQDDGAFPFASKVRPSANSYIRPNFIYADGVGEIGLYNSALSDDQLLGVVAFLKGINDQIRIGDSPCNTGNRLSIAPAFVSIPCPMGALLPAQLIPKGSRQFKSANRYLQLAEENLLMTTNQSTATSFDVNDGAKFNEYTIGISNRGTIVAHGGTDVRFRGPNLLVKPEADANQAWRAVDKVDSTGAHFFALESVAGNGFLCFQDPRQPTATADDVTVVLCRDSAKQIWFDR